ncbi:ABC transporter permease [Thiothrix litoralis]|jgi:lipopolysaccharide transport system permease protein|uniref:Transport permease protein n=1 Tax=Thiothrix litoralis TaxID=2891210 RepID=A0ABX7WNZ9_9GAMM|nr:ABC transporter permease [Thiothrix litoralis]QTR44871.1 ABC transporter permease [Thiothrix litoralis]
MNPHHPHPSDPSEMLHSFWKNRRLIWTLAKREVIGRYRGSVMGIAWSFFNPVFMLIVYTFVFSVVFKARWGVETDGGQASFAVILFAGMIVHGVFAECVNRAPTLVLANANYVKKVVFPLEILPWVGVIAALFHAAISVLVLLAAELMLMHYIPWTIVFLPVVLFPFIIAVMGISWFLASTGVFLRDVSQLTGLVTTVLLFMSPVFYPLSALPEKYQAILLLNPLTFIIEQVRQVVVWGHMPAWGGLFVYTIIACFVAWLGFSWFQKTRKGFADVI